MYCRNCGKEINNDTIFCPYCGTNQSKEYMASTQNYSSVQDAPNSGYALLGCCIPIVGLILYLVWKDETPLRAKSAGKGALIGVCSVAAFYLLYFIFIVGFVVSQ